jgi:hypothetical protein
VFGGGALGLVAVVAGLALAVVTAACLHAATARVGADAYGLHTRTLLCRRNVPWSEVDDLRIHVQYGRGSEVRRVGVALRGGRTWRLPLPVSSSSWPDGSDFDAKLAAMRALHRRYGNPGAGEADHVPVLTKRTAGRATVLPLLACFLLLAGAGVAAHSVNGAAAHERAWKSAAVCTAATLDADRGNCRTVVRTSIASTRYGRNYRHGWLYFTDGRPVRRVDVARDPAKAFQPGDRVEVTVWRHHVMAVEGKRYLWRDYFPTGGSTAVIAALLVLVAGYFGSLMLTHLRGRRLREDEILPSVLPFVGALVGTALWLLPLCYRYPTTLFSSSVAIGWGIAGVLATSVLFALAWRATRVRLPGANEDGALPPEPDDTEDVFLAAYFLDDTDYNPNGFGTHIVFGPGGSLAVTPHPGPGRFAARSVPIRRLTAGKVRLVRGDDGDTVPRSWHVAELDDGGRTVRLAASPENLTRILRELAREQGLLKAKIGS